MTVTNANLAQLKSTCVGITKAEIAGQLDKNNPLFNFSAEAGLTSYRNYSRDELLLICLENNIDPVSDYQKRRRGLL